MNPIMNMNMTQRIVWFHLVTLGFILSNILSDGLVSNAAAQGVTFEARPIEVTRIDPGETEALGWSPQGLDAVFDYAATLSSDTLIIATEGRVVARFGDTAARYDIHSMQKAILSALVGQHIGPGDKQIRLDATLAELGIDDSPNPLTPLQQTATVRDLLRSVSGINHAAAAEAGIMTAEKQRRLGSGENPPGKIWAYNNWDYNALTTILEQRTGLSIAEAFEIGLAIPLGLQDFTAEAAFYREQPQVSQHRAAAFTLSARDLAKIGQLYLDQGMVEGQAVLPASYIAHITDEVSATDNKDPLRAGHGYLWWIPGPESGLPPGSYWAWGLSQQALLVIPAWQTVIVHQSDTTEFRKRFFPALAEPGADAEQILLNMILSCFEPANRGTEFCREHRFLRPRDMAQLVSLIAAARL